MVMLVFGGVPSTFSLCPGSVNVRIYWGPSLLEKGRKASLLPRKVDSHKVGPGSSYK